MQTTRTTAVINLTGSTRRFLGGVSSSDSLADSAELSSSCSESESSDLIRSSGGVFCDGSVSLI